MQRMPQLRRCLPLLALAASLQLTLGYYDPAAQRWINRDPLPPAQFENLFAFVGNSPPGRFDGFGLVTDESLLYKCKPECVLVWDCSPRLGGVNYWSISRIHVFRIDFLGKTLILTCRTLLCSYNCTLKSAVGTGCPAGTVPGITMKEFRVDYTVDPWVTTCPAKGDLHEVL
jgi:hypothetical protein